MKASGADDFLRTKITMRRSKAQILKCTFPSEGTEIKVRFFSGKKGPLKSARHCIQCTPTLVGYVRRESFIILAGRQVLPSSSTTSFPAKE